MWLYVPTSKRFHYAPEMEASISDSSWRFQMLEQSVSWRGKLSVAKSWFREWKTLAWMKRLYGRIYEPSTATLGVESWIASLQDSLANQSAEQVEENEKNMSTGCGTMSCESSKKLTQSSFFVKTSMHYALMVGGGSSATLPHAGLMSRGTCFQQDPLEPRILARDSSFSPQNGTAWTTPLADDTGLRKNKYAQGGKPLSLQVREYCQEVLNYEPTGQNPDFREALMGWPIGWTDSGQPATASYQQWLLLHGQPSTTE